jgi:hypothetical protein
MKNLHVYMTQQNPTAPKPKPPSDASGGSGGRNNDTGT